MNAKVPHLPTYLTALDYYHNNQKRSAWANLQDSLRCVPLKLAPNTYLGRPTFDQSDDLIVTLHGNEIIRYRPCGLVTLHSAGYRTRTTAARINGILGDQIRLGQLKHEWVVYDAAWRPTPFVEGAPPWAYRNTEHLAFYRTMQERPDDDLPMLVLADWLDGHGAPEDATYYRELCQERAEARESESRWQDERRQANENGARAFLSC